MQYPKEFLEVLIKVQQLGVDIGDQNEPSFYIRNKTLLEYLENEEVIK